jgi:hypothetical protein
LAVVRVLANERTGRDFVGITLDRTTRSASASLLTHFPILISFNSTALMDHINPDHNPTSHTTHQQNVFIYT